MPGDVIQANYDELDAIARQFGQRAAAIGELRALIQRLAQPLEQGGWQGRGAEAFFAELSTQVYPAMQRLRQALDEARAVTLEASAIMRQAEQEAGALFRGHAVAGGAAGGAALAGASAGARASVSGGGGFLSGVGAFFSSVGGGIKDFATGALGEARDMVSGLKNLVLHPIETAKGIGYAITHPGEFWDGFKKPYVEAWENGRPWEAIGRGTMFAASFLLGAKGVDKAAKAAGLGSKAGEAGAIAGKAGRAGELGEAAGTAGRVGETAGTAGRVGEAGEAAGAAGRAGEAGEAAGTAGRTGEAGGAARAGEAASGAAPRINPQQQAGHVKGTPQYLNRVKQGKPTSAFDDAATAEQLVQEAWKNGTPVPGRPNVRDFDFQRPIGTGPKGGTQSRVRVHQKPNGEIHGHPSGPETPLPPGT